MNGAVLISSPGTGEGKTLAATALCAALRARGIPVQPYKIGPDYIDARFYESVCGRPAYNVDLWLDGPAGVRENIAATRGQARALVFEGMMGLFDGDNEGETSSAHIAALLDIPVVLVIDLWRCSQTAAAIALGCSQYAPRIRIAGVILNRIGGAEHERAVRRAFASTDIPVLATIPHSAAFALGERHLGLDPAGLQRRTEAVLAFAEILADQMDLSPFRSEAAPAAFSSRTLLAARARIAFTADEAFWFTYAETVAALREAGAELVPFSPLHDRTLPPAINGLWFSGGYPELHADELAANHSLRREIADAITAGMPIYAECGGLMYLAERLDTSTGAFDMVGVVRGTTSMRDARLHIGYRTANVLETTPLDEAGSSIRGYEFHYATDHLAPAQRAYRLDDGRLDGCATRSLCAAFTHRHFLPNDPAIARFIERCAAFS